MTCRARDDGTMRDEELENDEVPTLPGYTNKLEMIPEAERTEMERLEAEDLRLDELESEQAEAAAREVADAAAVEKATSLVDELAQKNQFEVELEGAHAACAPGCMPPDQSGTPHWGVYSPGTVSHLSSTWTQTDDRKLHLA